jgi:ABC-type phosphate/phosphonate transport system substrate-binding protein
MYDFGDLMPANDRFWFCAAKTLKEHGIAAPETLNREDDLWQIWQSRHLVLAQTCGYPYRARLHDKVALIGTPDYGLPDCAPGYYRSVFLARKDDPRRTIAAFSGARFAYNDALSQSGWANPQLFAQALGIHLMPGLKTGAHRASAQAVAESAADIAALDAVTWRHMLRNRLVPENLHVIDQTEQSPGLPYIAAKGANNSVMLSALRQAIGTLKEADRAVLGLQGIVEISSTTYLTMPNPPTPDQIAHSD